MHLPALVAATPMDEAGDGDLERLRSCAGGLDVVPVSVLDDGSLDEFRSAVWGMTGLIRIFLRDDPDPLALEPPVTVTDVADAVHHQMGARCRGARMSGPSARFPGQFVGPQHRLQDNDVVDIVTF